MKHWMLFLLMALGGARAFSQQDYFIYLQTDNHQAFYVRMGEKVYSSTASGYLIIPQLADSSYQLIAGFPANAFPEQYFNLDVRHKDAGYLLKNFGDKGWGLFNLQSLAVIMNSNALLEKKSPEISGPRKTDAFSTLLANAVNDTAILYVTKLAEPAPAKAVVQQAVVKETDTATTEKIAPPAIDTVIAVTPVPLVEKTVPPAVDSALVAKINAASDNKDTMPDTAAATVKKETTTPVSAPLVTNTLKVAELLTDTSYIAVYTDGTVEKFDTVRISIPLDKPGVLIPEAPRGNKQPVYHLPGETAAKDSSAAVATQQAMPEKPVIKDTVEAVAPVTTAETVQATDTTSADPVARPVIPNSDCKNLAWDSDIDKLRIKMLAAKTDDDRIIPAKKLFKQKCLTVKQVRALSELFTSDEGKYKWFDASYPSVSDTGNFAQLGELIKDQYYLSRFKAMIRH